MIKRFVFGKAFDTEAVKDKPEACKEKIPYFENAETSSFSLEMDSSDIVYGLGENVRGINKRGFIYESFCTDQPEHNENKSSLYAAHNFFIVSGNKKNFGAFFDSPGKVTFDIGASSYSTLKVSIENTGYEVYIPNARINYKRIQKFNRAKLHSSKMGIWNRTVKMGLHLRRRHKKNR